MKVVLDYVILNMDKVKLQVVPRLHKHTDELTPLIGESFQYRGEDLFRHLSTGKEYTLSASCFLDSPRFTWEGKRVSDVTTALQVKCKAFGRNTIFKARKIPIAAGTIYTDYKLKDNSYIVVCNDGSELSIPKTMCSIIIDVDTPYVKPVPKRLEAALAVTSETLSVVPNTVLEAAKVDTVPDDFSIQAVQTYRVKGLDMTFNTQEEAIFAAEILKKRDEFLNH